MPRQKGPTYDIVRALTRFIFYVVLFYSGWHLLKWCNVISGEPSSGWNWLLAMRAIWSEFDRFTGDLETQKKASGATGFWGPYRLNALSLVTEAAAFSTIIFHLGWLSVVSLSDYTALLAGTMTGAALAAVTRTAGRLRDRRWLAAIDDFAAGVVWVGSILFAYWSWLSSNGHVSDDRNWYAGIAVCAAVGGGINLWRKSFRDRQARAEA
jgi:hypothetical protein